MSGLRERAAEAAFGGWAKAEPGHGVTIFPASYRATFAEVAAAVLASLDHPETVAEVARALDEHVPTGGTYRHLDGRYDALCTCGSIEPYRRHAAALFLAHLAGRQPG